MSEAEIGRIMGTTIIAARRKGHVAIAGDGQMTLDRTVMKHRAKKVRRIFDGKVLAGFAGSVADALTLFERFEGRLQQFQGNLPRAAVEVAKEWRTDRTLRRLDALLVVADRDHLLVVSGSGEVIEPDDDLAAIGSGGPYALAAARALAKHTDLGASELVREALGIAAAICIYTNEEITVEEL